RKPPSKPVFPIRAVEDHHVDRPGVEAQQCVKLTGTNSSIGLIVLINQCSQRQSRCGFLCLTGRTGIAMTRLKPPLWPSLALRRGGAHAPGSSRRSSGSAPEASRSEPEPKSRKMCFSPTLWLLRGAQDPIPSRTRPSNPSAPMVLSLKTWESRSPQGLPKTHIPSLHQNTKKPPSRNARGLLCVRQPQAQGDECRYDRG